MHMDENKIKVYKKNSQQWNIRFGFILKLVA